MYGGDRCNRCGVLTGLMVVISCGPRLDASGYVYYGRARCLDVAKCTARAAKQTDRQRTRAAPLIVAEPKAPGSPAGTCWWCGGKLVSAANGRRYCYPDRERRSCVHLQRAARCYSARDALIVSAALRGEKDMRCVDCAVVVAVRWGEWRMVGRPGMPGWQADHRLALEDGGEHTLENLDVRCDPCHRAKTTAENSARARRRLPSSDQLPIFSES